MSYWIYQHLGNLSPPELDAERRCRASAPSARRRRAACAAGPGEDRESAASRWAFYRDLGDSRLLVLDSRAAACSTDGRRMIDEEEWDWIVDHSGRFDHLILASTLPVFLPPGIHHLEAWNEAVCAGRWGNRRPARRAAAPSGRSRALGGFRHTRSSGSVPGWPARPRRRSPGRPRPS